MAENKVETGTTLYDINKQGYEHIDPLTQEQLVEHKEKIAGWVKEQKSDFFMLLCRERNDYTIIIQKTSEKNVAKEALEVAAERGRILDIIKSDVFAGYEIWVRIGKESFMFLLFDCSGFIVEA